MSCVIPTVSNEVLDLIDMNQIQDDSYLDTHRYISKPSGEEHYRLLAHIARSNNAKKFIDLGTYMGWSALALAANPNNQVISYDIAECFYKQEAQLKPNITYKIKNFLNDLEELENTDLIMLDVDPHDGVKEREIVEKLIEQEYKGIVIMDDINNASLFPNLVSYFNNIPVRKENKTHLGHYSGTGILYFK
jgi:predicted O-methyltransferase YrrM